MNIKIIVKIIIFIDLFAFNFTQASPLIWQFTEITRYGAIEEYSLPSIDGKNVAFTFNDNGGFGSPGFLHPATETGHGPGAYIDAEGELITLAKKGITSNNDGDLFDNFGGISIYRKTAAFWAITIDPLTSNTQTGVYSYRNGGLNTIVDENTDIPEGVGKFITPNNLHFDLAPAIFRNTVIFKGEGIDGQRGLFSKTENSDLEILVNNDTIVPFDFDSSGLTRTFTNFGSAFSISEGNIAFGGIFTLPRATRNFTGIYNIIDGELTVVADVGSVLPDAPENSSLPGYALVPSFDRGDTSFRVDFYDKDSRQSLGDSIYANVNGSIQHIAETTDESRSSIDNGNIAFTSNNSIFTTIGGVVSEVWDDNFIPKEQLHEYIFPHTLYIGPNALSGNSVAFVMDINKEDTSESFTGIIRADLKGLNFVDFTESNFLKLNGDAKEENAVLTLTPDMPGKKGSVFFSSPLILSSSISFNTHFSFKISGENSSGSLGSEGFVFLIHGDPRKATAIGDIGGNLGIGSETEASILPSVAIEFDTNKNGFDSDGNHISLIGNGDVFHHIAPVSLPCSEDDNSQCFNNGKKKNVWIDYHGADTLMRIYLSESDIKPAVPVLSKKIIDLFHFIGEEAFFGFSAATGIGFNKHEIYNWQINFNLEGDLNSDSCIDQEDLKELIGVIRSGSDEIKYDLNNDGIINIADTRKLVTLFTKTRGASCT